VSNVTNNEIIRSTSDAVQELAGLPRRKDLYGLPCANCKAYYESHLAICPFCQCSERVSPKTTFARVAAAF